MTRVLEDRRVALEDAFFKQEEERRQERSRDEQDRKAAREALAEACPTDDDALLDRLVELGIRADTVEALVLIPLVEVAWCDGTMDRREREAVLRAAAESGIAEGSAGYALLESWTQQAPPRELFSSWRAYIGSLVDSLSADQRWALEEQIVGRARDVAAAAGGFLGVASVSKQEAAVLAELAKAFER